MVAARLQNVLAGFSLETIIFSTKGDKELDRPLPGIGGKGPFFAIPQKSSPTTSQPSRTRHVPLSGGTGQTIGWGLTRPFPQPHIPVLSEGFRVY